MNVFQSLKQGFLTKQQPNEFEYFVRYKICGIRIELITLFPQHLTVDEILLVSKTPICFLFASARNYVLNFFFVPIFCQKKRVSLDLREILLKKNFMTK